MMIDYQNIEWDKFQLAKSGRAIKLLYKKEPVQFCTSTMYSPFGVKSVVKDWSPCTEYSLDCSINQSNNDVSVSFRTFLEELDNKIKELVKDNLDIFNSKSPTTEFTYCPILRENNNYPKLLKLQFPRDKNTNFETFFFDETKNKIKMTESNIEEQLRKGKLFKCILECSKIWLYNGKVGSMWNVIQLKFSDIKQQTQESTESLDTQNNQNVYTKNLIDD